MRTRRWLSFLTVFTLACSADSSGSEAPSDTEAGDVGSSGSAGSDSDAASSGETGEAEASVTYYSDVKPILDARCAGCHAPGEVGPFSLTTYEEVVPVAELMLAVSEARTMPPWPASNECKTFEHNPSLSEEQLATMRDWLDAGTPMGDPALEGAPLGRNEVHLDRVDLTVGMSEGHVPAPTDGGIDEHRCFLLDWPETEPVYITGFETHPGNRAALHHFVGLIIPPEQVADMQASDDADPGYGWDCGAGTGMGGLAGELFATWVPGARANKLPQGTGQLIRPGSKILLNMHYNVLSGDYSPDQTMFDFQVETEVANPGQSFFATDFSWVAQRTMTIPAGEASVVHSSPVTQLQFGRQPYTIHSLGLHMHTLGTSASLFVERANGDRECLLDIPRWDFDWQMGYQLSEPVHIGEGDALHIECEWDNSPANQPVVDGAPMEPVDVNWGEDTYDEMCLGMVFVTSD